MIDVKKVPAEPDTAPCENHDHLTYSQLDLYDRMSEISEDGLCASWVFDIEYNIWDAIVNGNASPAYSRMSPRLLRRCQLLSMEIGGWIYWTDGPQFAPMAQWLTMVDSRRKLVAVRSPQSSACI